MQTHRWWIALGLGVTVALGAAGCSSQMDSSKTIARERIESGEVVAPDELRVAEYLNYYEQRFPEPEEGQVGLDLRLGNPQIPVDGGTAWLQIGLQARSSHAEDLAPLNMALVLDTSGSMSAEDKMPYLREAVRTFLGTLAANDRVAVVAYSDQPMLIEPSREVGDGRWITDAVDQLEPAGSTDLYDGLMTGIEEVTRHYDRRRNNLVVLLTDGIANVGETSPDAIAADAKAALGEEIRLATIGLGHEFNDALLSNLAREGNGTYHYVDRPDELNRVFRDAAQGMLQKVASNVTVVIHPGHGVRVESVTGLDSTPPGRDLSVQFTDLGSGESQVLLAELTVGPDDVGPRELATILVSYRDEVSGREERLSSAALVEPARLRSYDPLRDTEVLRNVTIQRTAEALRSVATLYDGGRYDEAWRVARDAEQELRHVADLTGETALREDADLMREYEDTLSQWVDVGSLDVGGDNPLPPRRGRLATPTPVRLR